MFDITFKVVNVCEQIYFLTEITCLVAALEYYWPIVPHSLWFYHLPQCNPMYGKYVWVGMTCFLQRYSITFPFYDSLWQSSISVKVILLLIFEEEKNPFMKFLTIFYHFFTSFTIFLRFELTQRLKVRKSSESGSKKVRISRKSSEFCLFSSPGPMVRDTFSFGHTEQVLKWHKLW